MPRSRPWCHPVILVGLTVVIVGAIPWLVAPLAAQPANPAPFADSVEFLRAKVTEWRHAYRVSVALTLGVGISGIVLGALQIRRASWIQAVVFVVGLASSIAAIVNNTLYHSDFRAYQRLVTAGELGILELQSKARELGPTPTPAERHEVSDQMLRVVMRLVELEKSILGSGPPADPAATPKTGSLDVLPVAHAAAVSPAAACASRWKSNQEYAYFVGIGGDADLGVAKEESRQNAIESMIEAVASQVPAASGLDAGGLGRYLSQAASLVDSCYDKASPAGEYRYFTVLRVTREVLGRGTALYAAREGKAVPSQTQRAVQSAAPDDLDYRLTRQDVYDQLARDAAKTVPADVLQLYSDGRVARRSGNCKKAIPPLTEAARRRPDFYLAHFNLGLALEACGDLAGAEQAYKRAIDVAPAKPTCDASVFNTYGWLLLRSNRPGPAVTEFERALLCEKDHPKAKANLAYAKQQLARGR